MLECKAGEKTVTGAQNTQKNDTQNKKKNYFLREMEVYFLVFISKNSGYNFRQEITTV